MEIFPPKKIKIADVKGKGRGVIATENIFKGEVIEYCPIIPISNNEVSFFKNESENIKYYYLFQYAINRHCIMLGYGSIYNHSKYPNADVDYDVREPKNYLLFEAIKDIKPGEEISIDYEFDNDKEEFLDLP